MASAYLITTFKVSFSNSSYAVEHQLNRFLF